MTIGWQPHHENIILNGGDCIFSREDERGPLPPGTTAEVRWGNGVVWPGTIDGATASWRVEAEDCTAAIIPRHTPFSIMVAYPNAVTSTTDDYPLTSGRAVRTDNL